MIDFYAATVELVDMLQASGVRATLDARGLNPPAVLVHPPRFALQFNGTAQAEYDLVVAVPDTGTHDSLNSLSELVNQVLEALGGHLLTGEPAVVTLSDGPPVPGYRLTYTEDIGG